MVRFLDPETTEILPFLDPEIVKIDQQISGSRNPRIGWQILYGTFFQYAFISFSKFGSETNWNELNVKDPLHLAHVSQKFGIETQNLLNHAKPAIETFKTVTWIVRYC